MARSSERDVVIHVVGLAVADLRFASDAGTIAIAAAAGETGRRFRRVVANDAEDGDKRKPAELAVLVRTRSQGDDRIAELPVTLEVAHLLRNGATAADRCGPKDHHRAGPQVHHRQAEAVCPGV